MKIVYTKYYCDICNREMDFPRFIHIKRKIFNINIWNDKYEFVCGDCVRSVEEHIRDIRSDYANFNKKD